MAGHIDGGYGTVSPQQTTDRCIRVKRDGTIAGATDRDFGVTVAAGQPESSAPGVYNTEVTVSLINKQGTQEVTLSGTAGAGVEVYTAADGKVSTTAASGSYLRGVTQQAGVDGEIIEILPILASAAEA